MHVNKTRNDLKSNTKTTVAALLNARLADTIDLALMTKQAHTGTPTFWPSASCSSVELQLARHRELWKARDSSPIQLISSAWMTM